MQAPAGRPPQQQGACSSCGRPIDALSATLSKTTGLPVCPACVASEGLYEQQGRAVKSLAWGALGGSLGAPLVTFCVCGPAGLVASAAAIASGVRALMLLGQPDYERRTDRSLLTAISIVAIVLASMSGLVGVLALAGVVGSALLRAR
jgi:hypothetical protein